MALDRFPQSLRSGDHVALLEVRVLPDGPAPHDGVARSASHDGVARLAVAGEIDSLTAGSLHAALAAVLREHDPHRIELDLSDVTFMESAGVRTLLTGVVMAQRTGCDLLVVRASPAVYRLLRICGLLDVLGVTHEEPSAGERVAG
ncbi:STAS domain-containing protein [Dactylosporangium sp. NPDC050688]|uniref:STAS domain-containing protein n=1 Tax=Dactylosporangium sp. NPDC050688 TaxID=3157217 RepID=UPI0033EE0272